MTEDIDKLDVSRNERIVQMRDGGASWKEIEAAFAVTRQQARYAYQLGKRAERRQKRRLD
jgi:hypothetical protein